MLAQVSTTYHEDLSGDVDSSVTPLPPLSLGVWHAVLSLNSPRAWGNMLSTAKPSTADQFFIFSFGGLSDASTPLATYDYATVTVSPAASAKGRENQTMSAWITGGNSLATARYGHSSVTLTNEFVPQVPADTTQIYIGGGRITGNSFSQVIETAELSADGELTFADTTNSDNGPLARAGYCMFVYKTTSGQIGFTGGASSAQGKAGSFTDVAAFGSSWNAGWSGTNLNLISCVKLRPFVFIAGGTDGTTASAQTLYNIV